MSTKHRSLDELVTQCGLVEITDTECLQRAIDQIRTLTGIERTEEEDDYLDALGDLVYAYEQEHVRPLYDAKPEAPLK